MLIRNRNGNTTFVRTYYQAGAGTKHKSLGSIKNTAANDPEAVRKLMEKLNKSEATPDEREEINAWIATQVEGLRQESQQSRKSLIVDLLNNIDSTLADPEILALVSDEDGQQIFSIIKNLEEKLRSAGIKRKRNRSTTK